MRISCWFVAGRTNKNGSSKGQALVRPWPGRSPGGAPRTHYQLGQLDACQLRQEVAQRPCCDDVPLLLIQANRLLCDRRRLLRLAGQAKNLSEIGHRLGVVVEIVSARS